MIWKKKPSGWWNEATNVLAPVLRSIENSPVDPRGPPSVAYKMPLVESNAIPTAKSLNPV